MNLIEYENLNKVNKFLEKKILKRVSAFLKNGNYILGENVSNFEKIFSKFIKNRFSAGVGNGLDALIISLNSLNLKPNDEIIVSCHTYIATILAIIRVGLKPVLVEPDIFTYNISPEEIKKNISKKTRAIVVTHMYGKSCDMHPILDIVNKYRLFLIEDCAQSHGAQYFKKYTGTFGDYGCFSFYPTKNLGGFGDGGLITSNIRKNIEKVKKLRNYGFKAKNITEYLGFNSRLDEIQATFLIEKIKYLKKINEHKRRLAEIYFYYLSDNFIKPIIDKNFYDVYHIFPIRINERDKLIAYLKKKGVETAIHYPIPPHKQKPFNSIFKNSFPLTEQIHKTILSLPVSFFHSEKDIIRICKIINKF
jgi:dTDP-4-amino-4,6-dideoxygalactose transaminase